MVDQGEGFMQLTRRSALVGLSAAAGLIGSRAEARDAPVSVPMRRAVGVPWVSARLDDATGLRMRLATTAQLFRADERTIRAANLSLLRQLRVGDEQRMYRATQLGIGGAYGFRDIEVVASGEGAEDSLFHGAIPLMQDRPSLYDFAADRFVVGWTPEAGFVGADMAPAGGGRERWMRLPAVRVELDGVALTLLVDTASPYAVSLFPEAVKRLGLWDRWSGGYERVAADEAAGKAGHSVRVRRAGTLRILDWTLSGPVIGLSHPDGPRDQVERVDGRIGMDVLGRFAVGFEPVGWRIHARPTEGLYAPFRHDRSGLQVGRRDGEWRVLAVDEQSPAEAAGARVGDVLPDLNRTRAAALEWEASSPDGAPLDLTLRRDGVDTPIRIVLADRL